MAELDVDKVGWFSENILNNSKHSKVCRTSCSKYFQENKYKNQKILHEIPNKIFCKLEIVLVLRSMVEMKRSMPSIALSSKTNENLPVFARKCFKTRPSILCVIHQMSRKTRNYSVG